MDAAAWIAIAVLALIVIALIVWAVARKRRTDTLRDRFGPEYDRAVTEEGGRRGGESVLSDRVRRRDELNIQPLGRAAAQRYSSEWQNVQARFVDNPSEALGQADRLIGAVMRERGYPMDDFEQRSADISVDHPDVVDDYRAGHAISMANDQGMASTEDLRQAMVHYRSLFERIVEIERRPASEVGEQPASEVGKQPASEVGEQPASEVGEQRASDGEEQASDQGASR